MLLYKAVLLARVRLGLHLAVAASGWAGLDPAPTMAELFGAFTPSPPSLWTLFELVSTRSVHQVQQGHGRLQHGPST